MVVTVTLAETTVLRNESTLSVCKYMYITLQLTCLPTEVRPRASRRLCTGFVIQLILGSRRIYTQMSTKVQDGDRMSLTAL